MLNKMSFSQMESLKVVEKFDGGNCHLCMGFGSLLMVVQQFQMMKMNWWTTMRRWPRHLHYFVNISWMHNLHTFNIVKMSRMLRKHFALLGNETHWKQVVSSKEIFQHQNVRRARLACTHQHGEGTSWSIMFHWGNDWGQRRVHVTSHEPSFVFW